MVLPKRYYATPWVDVVHNDFSAIEQEAQNQFASIYHTLTPLVSLGSIVKQTFSPIRQPAACKK